MTPLSSCNLAQTKMAAGNLKAFNTKINVHRKYHKNNN